MKRGGPLPKQSANRKRDERIRAKVLKAARVRDGNRCQFFEHLDEATISLRSARALPQRCFGHLDGQEIIPRSAWPDGWLVLDNVVMICRAHHDWIGDWPDDAEKIGLHGRSWDRPQGHQ